MEITDLTIQILSNWITPKLSSLLNIGLNSVTKEGKKAIHDIENNFKEYLERKYKKYSFVDTLVFPNRQTKFI